MNDPVVVLRQALEHAASKMSVEDAYAQLVNSQPQSELERLLKESFLNGLPERLKTSIPQKIQTTFDEKSEVEMVQIANSPKQRINISLKNSSKLSSKVHPLNQNSLEREKQN